jgi:hypothetical protein
MHGYPDAKRLKAVGEGRRRAGVASRNGIKGFGAELSAFLFYRNIFWTFEPLPASLAAMRSRHTKAERRSGKRLVVAVARASQATKKTRRKENAG